ncbi:hypothetical protein PCORN_10507 [Listeria cornellensis FSL F6-0969]|uniref:Uncharacterized protein n=1 Tax=Listeria cornellensis FSL F6-0969 TaxID=1265820 RepID=W7BS57_9LIST|nr:hypothetical protein PCORN_10507 [Listeria cornellensis FSL F6-0969]
MKTKIYRITVFFSSDEKHVDTLVINKKDGQWIVYTNGERAAKTSEKKYNSERFGMEHLNN